MFALSQLVDVPVVVSVAPLTEDARSCIVKGD